MTGKEWLLVPNWSRFQHYKDRRPTWIKIYTALLDDPDFLELTEGARLLLFNLWLMYASSHAQVRLNPRSLSRRFNMRVTSAQLASLNHAGFIEFAASKPLASRPPAPSREGEKKEQTLTHSEPHSNSRREWPSENLLRSIDDA